MEAANDNCAWARQHYDSAAGCRLAAQEHDGWTAKVLRRHARLQDRRGREIAVGIGRDDSLRSVVSTAQQRAGTGGG